jgi:hypothetical protein
MKFIDFFKTEFISLLKKDVKITFRTSDTEGSEFSNMGELSGVDLDATRYCGYIYYWGDGFLDYSVYDMVEDETVVNTTLIATEDFSSHLDKIRLVVSYFTA